MHAAACTDAQLLHKSKETCFFLNADFDARAQSMLSVSRITYFPKACTRRASQMQNFNLYPKNCVNFSRETLFVSSRRNTSYRSSERAIVFWMRGLNMHRAPETRSHRQLCRLFIGEGRNRSDRSAKTSVRDDRVPRAAPKKVTSRRGSLIHFASLCRRKRCASSNGLSIQPTRPLGRCSLTIRHLVGPRSSRRIAHPIFNDEKSDGTDARRAYSRVESIKPSHPPEISSTSNLY